MNISYVYVHILYNHFIFVLFFFLFIVYSVNNHYVVLYKCTKIKIYILCISVRSNKLLPYHIIWIKIIHYQNKIRSYLVTIAPMAPFTTKITSYLRSALHFRYSIVIPCFIPHANTAQS